MVNWKQIRILANKTIFFFCILSNDVPLSPANKHCNRNKIHGLKYVTSDRFWFCFNILRFSFKQHHFSCYKKCCAMTLSNWKKPETLRNGDVTKTNFWLKSHEQLKMLQRTNKLIRYLVRHRCFSLLKRWKIKFQR